MLIGGMKCGSTTVHRQLGCHPEIAASRPKEPQYLAMPRAWRKGRGWYESCFRYDAGRHRYALDGSAAYSNTHRYPHVPGRMRELGGQVKVLYVLRDPIARMRSHILHDAATPWGGAPDGPRSRRYLDASDYAGHLDAYLAHFDRRDIHVLTLESLAADPRAALASACRFLDIDAAFPFPQPAQPVNASPPAYLRTRAWMRALWHATPGYTPRRALRWATQRARRTRLPARLVFSEAPLVLGPDWESTARAALAPSMHRLHRDWGVDVSAWGFQSA